MKNYIIVNLTKNHEYKCESIIIARKNENHAACFKIIVPEELREKWLFIDFEKPSGAKVKTPKIEIDSEGYAYYEICNNLTDEVGILNVEMSFQDSNSFVWKTFNKKYHIADSISATDEIEKENPDFISDAQKKIDEVQNLDIDINKVDSTATVTITKKDGKTKEVEIFDGATGPQGKEGPPGPQGEKPVKGVDYFTQDDINSMVSSITENANSVFNQNVESKTKTFNDNATTQTKAFNENVETKKTEFDNNASSKLSAYNTNAEASLKTYNDNSTAKLKEYNDNATLKEEEYNSNATARMEEFNQIASDYDQRITANEEYLDTITPKNTAKGELVHITDALPLPTFETTADGNVEQETTKGNQLLPYLTVGTHTMGNIKIDVDKDGYIYISGSNTYITYINVLPITTLKAGTYTMKVEGVTSDIKVSWSNVNTFTKDGYISKTYSEDTKTSSQIIIPANVTYTNYKMQVFLYEGAYDSTKELEPFTNGASPNLSYPQEIEVLEGYNFFNHNVAKNDCIVDSKTGEITITKDTTDIYIQGAFVYNENNKFMTLEKGQYCIGSTNPNVRVTMYSDGLALDTGGTQQIVLSSITNFGGIRIRSTNGQSLLNQKFGVVVNKGSYFKPYLPYGHIGYKVNGKQLFNKDDVVVGYIDNNGVLHNEQRNRTSNYIKVQPNSNYVRTSTNGNIFYDKDKNFISYAWGNNFITPSNCKYVRIVLIINDIDNEKLEKGSVATDYEPYQEQIVYLDLKGNFVGKIKDSEIEDELYTDKKNIWLDKNVNKRIFTGEEDWVENTSVGTIELLINDKYARYGFDGLMCSHFHIRTGTDTSNYVGIDNNHTNIRIWGTNMTRDEFKAFAKEEYNKGTPITLVYQTKETETKHLGELPEPIKTFEGVNNIQVLANLDTEIEVLYGLDIKKYYDNKIASIQEQIL